MVEKYPPGMKNLIQHTTELAMHIAKDYIRPSGLVIDATCGNGHDTLALAKALWPDKRDGGKLLAFDVQKAAIENTRTALIEAGFGAQIDSGQIVLIQDDHANIADHINTDTIDRDSTYFNQSIDNVACGRQIANYTARACLVVFNLGYLPGGDKQITTSTDTTLAAAKAALDLLDKDGLLCITMYSGHEAGAIEKQALLAFAEELDSHIFHVAYVNMINQANNPPEILLISRKC